MRRTSLSLRSMLVLVMAACLIVPLAGMAASAPITPTGTFLDDDGDIHEGYIEAIAELGITKGCNPPANDAYCPRLPATRAQVASFLVRSLATLGPVPTEAENAFTDDEGNVHEPNIDVLAALGITKGCNPPLNTEYCPNATMTRGQMAAFLTRAFGYVDDDPAANRFIDDDGSIFETDIEALAAAGVTLGCNPPANTEFCPNDPVYRDQMASFLGRALGLTPLPPPSVADAEFVTAFFMVGQPATAGPYLVAVARYVPAGTATPEMAVEKLLAGPTVDELSAQIPAFSTSIPAGTTLLGLTVAGGVATVDLSGEFDDGGGSFSMLSRLGQLTFTLVQFDGIDDVVLELDGVPVTLFSSEGIDISGGLDPAYFFDTGVMPELLNTSPAAWQYVESPVQVEGWSRAFEATFLFTLTDDDGLPLAEGFVTGGGAGPEFGEFSFSAPFAVDRPQLGTLILYNLSAKDGSVIDLRETPIWLEP
jgi:hypothetical protein